MTLSNTFALFITMLILSATPSPSDFAIVARSMGSGFRQGLVMACGMAVGDFVFIVFAIYSLSELAESMNQVFVALKYVCAAYLIWLGFNTLRSTPASTEVQALKASSSYSSFLSGLLMTLGDPLAILFYMGLLPAFVNLSDISAVDTLKIMFVAAIAVITVKTTYAYLADKATRLFKNIRVRRRLNIISGCVLVATGAVLLTQ